MSTTYHISFELPGAKLVTVHPRAAAVYAARINTCAKRDNISGASAAGGVLNLGLIDNGISAEVDRVHPEGLGIASGVLQEIETAAAVACAALARPRPAYADALRVWREQQNSADHSSQVIGAAIDALQQWQLVRVDDVIESIAKSIADRPVGTEERGELNVHDLTKSGTGIHPRVRGTRAQRLREWAARNDVSDTSAASAFLNHALKNESAGIAFHVPASETLSVALGELQGLATALRINVPALARARPRGGDARRLWADQSAAADAALSRVVPAVSNLLKILRLFKAGSVGFGAKRIAARSEPSAPKGGAS